MGTHAGRATVARPYPDSSITRNRLSCRQMANSSVPGRRNAGIFVGSGPLLPALFRHANHIRKSEEGWATSSASRNRPSFIIHHSPRPSRFPLFAPDEPDVSREDARERDHDHQHHAGVRTAQADLVGTEQRLIQRALSVCVAVSLGPVTAFGEGHVAPHGCGWVWSAKPRSPAGPTPPSPPSPNLIPNRSPPRPSGGSPAGLSRGSRVA